MISIALNPFVKRQTKESSFSHYEKTWEELLHLVLLHFPQREVVQRNLSHQERVVLVPLPPQHFYTNTILVDENSVLRAEFFKREEKEEGFVKCYARGQKQRAHYAKAVLYSHEALKEDESQSSESDFEIISLIASHQEKEPMHPITMARNYLEKVGGTKAHYSLEEVMEAIWYWKDKVSVDSE